MKLLKSNIANGFETINATVSELMLTNIFSLSLHLAYFTLYMWTTKSGKNAGNAVYLQPIASPAQTPPMTYNDRLHPSKYIITAIKQVKEDQNAVDVSTVAK